MTLMITVIVRNPSSIWVSFLFMAVLIVSLVLKASCTSMIAIPPVVKVFGVSRSLGCRGRSNC